MKKLLTLCLLAILGTFAAQAQKYALIDMDYILKKIPQYEIANQQLNQASKGWQQEVENLAASAEAMYKQYQADLVYLTPEQKNDVITRGINNEYVIKYNDFDYTHFFLNKADFNNKFNKYLKREWIEIDTASDQD